MMRKKERIRIINMLLERERIIGNINQKINFHIFILNIY
jgi:hypothetical protein